MSSRGQVDNTVRLHGARGYVDSGGELVVQYSIDTFSIFTL